MKKTLIAVVLTLVLCLCAFGTTLAFLIDKTEPVVNTFTVGNVDITLTETDAVDGAKSFKMVPGNKITKDPEVTVVGGSEDCYLFVKVEKSDNFDTFITSDMDDAWTVLDATNHPGVYYRTVAASNADQTFSVLKGDAVTVNDSVTKTMMSALTEATRPTITFTAYAVQQAHVADAAEAWTLAQNPANY